MPILKIGRNSFRHLSRSVYEHDLARAAARHSRKGGGAADVSSADDAELHSISPRAAAAYVAMSFTLRLMLFTTRVVYILPRPNTGTAAPVTQAMADSPCGHEDEASRRYLVICCST